MMSFALVVVMQKLRPYFQAHPIKVLTNTPLKKALQWPDASGCLMNWDIELSEFDIEFLPHIEMKE